MRWGGVSSLLHEPKLNGFILPSLMLTIGSDHLRLTCGCSLVSITAVILKHAPGTPGQAQLGWRKNLDCLGGSLRNSLRTTAVK